MHVCCAIHYSAFTVTDLCALFVDSSDCMVYGIKIHSGRLLAICGVPLSTCSHKFRYFLFVLSFDMFKRQTFLLSLQWFKMPHSFDSFPKQMDFTHYFMCYEITKKKGLSCRRFYMVSILPFATIQQSAFLKYRAVRSWDTVFSILIQCGCFFSS